MEDSVTWRRKSVNSQVRPRSISIEEDQHCVSVRYHRPSESQRSRPAFSTSIFHMLLRLPLADCLFVPSV